MADNPLGVRPDWLEPITLRLSGEATEYAQTRIAVRDHTVIIDEPPERGGLDGGPAPTEMLIATLIGATTVFVRRMARRDNVLIESVTIEAEADLDRRGLWLTETIPVPWETIRLSVTLVTEADDATLARWKSDMGRFSPIHGTLRAAGIAVDEIWVRRKG